MMRGRLDRPFARRLGARDRVTGSAALRGRSPFDDALHVKLVYLDCARAAIKSIDSREALTGARRGRAC